MGTYNCVQCGHSKFVRGEIAATGTGFTRLLDLQGHDFIYVSCSQCGKTEFFNKFIVTQKSNSGKMWLDAIFGS